METVTTLVGIQPATLFAWFHGLADVINSDQSPDSCRPPSPTPIPVHIDLHYRPVYARQHGPNLGVLYASRPVFGEPLLVLTVEPIGNDTLRIYPWRSEKFAVHAETMRQFLEAQFDQAQPAPSDTTSPSCAAKSSMGVPVVSSTLPPNLNTGAPQPAVVSHLSPDAWLAAAMAHMPDPFAHGTSPANDEPAEEDPAPETPQFSTEEWLALAMVEIPDPLIHGHLTRMVRSHAVGAPRPPRTTRLTSEQWLAAAMRRLPDPRDHSRFVEAWLRRCQELDVRARTYGASGAPVHSCNQWLQEALACLPEPSDNFHLYDAWLEHYQKEHGFAPRDSRRSFDRAVKGRLAQLKEDAASAAASALN